MLTLPLLSWHSRGHFLCLSPSEISRRRIAMKIPLPSEDTLLTASALGAAALGAQVSHSGSLGHAKAQLKPLRALIIPRPRSGQS